MIPRTLTTSIASIRSSYPAIAITGPRQSGKTTLCRQTFSDLPYVNLENPLAQRECLGDPIGFLARHPHGAVLDEVQNVPEFLSHLQVRIDEDPRMGRWVLSGSQQIGLTQGISQSLAGRVALLDLLPFSYAEVQGSPRCPATFEDAVLLGGYPPIFDPRRGVDPGRWLDDYIATFINRDVRDVLEIRSRTTFDHFLRHCAARSAQVVNRSDLARDCGVDPKTIRSWLAVLEASHVIRLVHPHHRNFGKRLVKSPKLYFVDSGLACRLLHVRDVGQLRAHPLWGNLVETWFVSEVVKSMTHRGLRAPLWYWRSSDGIEIDLVLEQGAGLLPIEAKATATPGSREAASIEKVRRLAGRDPLVRVLPGFVLHGGDVAESIGVDRLVPWQAVDAGLAELR